MLARILRSLIAGALGVALATPAPAAGLAGFVDIIDGDTLVVSGQVVRLQGIDAPEGAQLCLRKDERKWPCGQRAADALKALVDNRAVRCRGEGRDENGWLLAVCTSAAGHEINRALVAAGYAIADRAVSQAYVAAEQGARRDGLGLWSGPFEAPGDYRKRRWAAAGEAAPEPECPIKGNIDRDGRRIYLLPHSRAYGWAQIDSRRGERWFCSVGAAREAGWQAPLFY